MARGTVPRTVAEVIHKISFRVWLIARIGNFRRKRWKLYFAGIHFLTINVPSEQELTLRFSVATFIAPFTYISENTGGKLPILMSRKRPIANVLPTQMPRLKNAGDLWKREREGEKKAKNNCHFSKGKTGISYHPNNTVQIQSTFVATSLLVFDCSSCVKLHACFWKWN